MPDKIAVFYNNQRPGLFLSVAAIFQTYERLPGDVIALPVNPALLADEKELQLAIAAARNNPYFDGSAYEDEERWCPEENDSSLKIILLDIGPKDHDDMIHLMAFFDRHEMEILLWLDTTNTWFPNQQAYFNSHGPLLHSCHQLSTLNLLREYGHKPEEEWLHIEKLLLDEDYREISRNDLARRFFQATWASCADADDIRDEISYTTFMAIVFECLDNRLFDEVSQMCKYFEKMRSGL